MAAVLIGIWILNAEYLDLGAAIGRVSLIPLLITGSWFCASQHLKLVNLAEDYAYKDVLAKSIVGFSDQLKSNEDKGEEYKKYIEKMLEEIHRDPIHRDAKKNDKGIEFSELLKKIDEIKPTLDKIVESVKKSS